MARTFADILHDYEEAQAELDAMAGYEETYPEHYENVYAAWERARDAYNAAVGQNQSIEYDEGDDPFICPAEGEKVPLMSEPDPEPNLICGGGDTIYMGDGAGLLLEAACQHDAGRTSSSGGVLKVVTDASGGDLITIKNKLGGAVDWSCDYGNFSSQEDTSCTFAAKAGVVKSFWLLTVDPTVYTVTGECEGQQHSVTIHAYSATEISKQWAIDRDIIESLRKGADLVKGQAKTFLGIELGITWPAGEITLSCQWKEGAAGDQAEFGAKAEGKLTLFGISGKYVLGSDRLRNAVAKIPGVGEYVGSVVDWLIKANAYLQAGGALNLSGGVDTQKGADKTIATLASSFFLKLGAEAGMAGGECIKVEADVGASIVPSGGLKWDDKGIFVQFGVKFGGLKGAVTIKMAWGLLAWQESWTIIDEVTLYPSADSPGGTGRWYPALD